tara:strand:- start:942 stop:1901 length:960 start_codon:yes stop_codon:yes gene_type:complete
MKKKILVTGGYGLLASTLINKLAKKKFNVISIDKKKNFYRYKNKKPKHYKVVLGDFRSRKFILHIIKKNKIDVIFHLGAITQVLSSLEKPLDTYKNNIMGTINILECIREINPKIVMIYASSDKAYGEKDSNNYKENDKLNAIYPYDVSKSASDLISQSYSFTYGLSVGILRCGNLYGPGDFNLKRIVPETIINCIRNQKLKIRSNGKLTRDYLFVEDAAEAYYLVMNKLVKSKKDKLLIYNVSSKFNSNVLNLVKKIQSKINNKFNYSIANSSSHEIKKQKLNYSKITKELGWKPKTNLQNGLNKTISWYQKNISLFK